MKTRNNFAGCRRSRPAGLTAGLFAAMLLLAGAAQSQTIYRIVGADGRITFSDKPPAETEKATELDSGGRPVAAGTASLPAELRQVAGKYPVSLYTSTGCLPCNQGRDLLTNRGIPFTEKTVSTPEDSAALQRISGDNSLPLLSIGAQQIKGFSDSEWSQFLDAAAYPKTSALPTTYRNPLPEPLVIVQKAAPANRPQETQNPVTPVQPKSVSPANPAGIQF